MTLAKLKYPIIRPTVPDTAGLADEFLQIIESGIITCGPRVAELERRGAELLGVADCVAVSCCTSGLILAAKALELTGEVIVPAFTFVASAHALVWAGLKPVFCDSLPGTYNLDPDDVAAKITKDTSAIMPVYIFGLPPDFDRLLPLAKKHGIKVLCDAAQAMGATCNDRPAGTFGDVEVFSMSPTKVVTAVEGGLITVRDAEMARKLRSMRDYGKAADGCDMEFIGLSARMSELHAAVGLRSLAHCRDLVERRRNLVTLYREKLAGLPGVSFQEIPEGRTTSYNYMVIFVGEDATMSRDDLCVALGDCGIQTKKYFYPAVHEMTAYSELGQSCRGTLPVAEKASRTGLALPLYSHMAKEDVDAICKRVLNLLD
jgi:dTDP-4-amino-4,6-dideoxygalactose transaminase